VQQNQPLQDAFLSGIAPLAVLGGVLLGVLLAAAILLGTMATGDGAITAMQAIGDETVGNTEAVGWVLYTTYLVPFEVISVVLLVAMIGAIVFGRRDAALTDPGEGVER
jgi:NADH-quinone oxidoreductase subunit J